MNLWQRFLLLFKPRRCPRCMLLKEHASIAVPCPYPDCGLGLYKDPDK